MPLFATSEGQVRESSKDGIDSDGSFESGDCGAEAGVETETEANVSSRGSLNIEALRILKFARVMVGTRSNKVRGRIGRNYFSAHLDFLSHPTHFGLGWSVVSKEFLNR